MSTSRAVTVEARVLKLRDRLIERGAPSIAPGRPISADSEALVQRVRPFALVMLLIVTADGELAESERTTIRGAFRSLTGGRVSTAHLDGLLQELEASTRERGREACLERVAAELCGNRDDSELALALGVAVAAADDEFRASESAMLVELAELLGISQKRRAELLGPIP